MVPRAVPRAVPGDSLRASRFLKKKTKEDILINFFEI